MFQLPRIKKSRFKAAFLELKYLLKNINIEVAKKLKPVYIFAIGVTCFKFRNIYTVLTINIMIDLSITLLYLKFKSKKEIKVDDVTFLEHSNPKSLNSGNFDSTIKATKPPKGMKLPFLLGFDGVKHVYADLSKFIHTLIAGRSGKGKSNFINQLLQSLLIHNKGNLIMFLCDMKVVELCHDYACFPQCETFSDAETLLTVIKNIRVEMQLRYQLLRNVKPGQKSYKKIEDYNADHEPLPYIMLLIDEFADVNCLKDEALKTQIWDELKWVLREGRAAGIIILLATQRPTKENISPAVKGLFVSFVGFGVRDNNESFYCGVKGSANLEIGEIIVAGEGEEFNNTKFKSYHIKPKDKIYYKLYKYFKKEKENKKYEQTG